MGIRRGLINQFYISWADFLTMRTLTALMTFVTLSLILASPSEASSSCSFCPVKHTQQHYCDSSVVIKGRVLTMAKTKTLAIFKGKEDVFLRAKRRVLSLSLPDCMASRLIIGKTYLLMGSFYGNRLKIGSCDLVQPWSSLTSIQKDGVKEVYKMFCGQCKINSTYSIIRPRLDVDASWEGNFIDGFGSMDRDTDLWEGEGCFYNPLASKQYMVSDCETKFTVCAPNENGGTCSWLSTSKYRSCERKRKSSPCARSANTFALPSWSCDTDCSGISERCMREMCLRDTASTACAPRYREPSYNIPDLTIV